MITKTNLFSRSVANEEKMGAYYTDKGHCERIGYLFDFPADEVSSLDPSAGDGVALSTVVGKSNSKLFGVELNAEAAQKLRETKIVNYVLEADFLCGVKISHGSFGFCFANPPYGELENGNRLEVKFLDKLYPYLKKGAPIAYVIPFYVLSNEKFQRQLLSHFTQCKAYRFDDKVYSQYKQCVVVAVKKADNGYFRKDLDAFIEQVADIENLPFLPRSREEVTEKLSAVPSEADKIEYFTTLAFDAKEAAKNLMFSPLHDKAGAFLMPKYEAMKIGHPPIPLKRDLLYLLSVSGGGQGLVGSEETGDLHLQRGVSKVVKTVSSEEDEETGKVVEVESSYTQTQLNIIENDGTITVLS